MSRKTVSTIVLFLLMINTLTLAFKIQSVKADTGTITINADGSISPSTAPIYTADNITYTLNGNITADADGIVIYRDNIILDGAGFTVTGNDIGNGTMLVDVGNVTLRDMVITYFFGGISLISCSDCVLSGNNVTTPSSDYGIELWFSSGCVLSENNVANSYSGILLHQSYDCILSGNTVTSTISDGIILYSASDGNTLTGNNVTVDGAADIYLGDSTNNHIFLNNFVYSTTPVSVFNSLANAWDNGSMGNYWSGYMTEYPFATRLGSVWNIPYMIDANNIDHYPLMTQYAAVPEFSSSLALSLFMVTSLLALIIYKKRDVKTRRVRAAEMKQLKVARSARTGHHSLLQMVNGDKNGQVNQN